MTHSYVKSPCSCQACICVCVCVYVRVCMFACVYVYVSVNEAKEEEEKKDERKSGTYAEFITTVNRTCRASVETPEFFGKRRTSLLVSTHMFQT